MVSPLRSIIIANSSIKTNAKTLTSSRTKNVITIIYLNSCCELTAQCSMFFKLPWIKFYLNASHAYYDCLSNISADTVFPREIWCSHNDSLLALFRQYRIVSRTIISDEFQGCLVILKGRTSCTKINKIPAQNFDFCSSAILTIHEMSRFFNLSLFISFFCFSNLYKLLACPKSMS